jgi:hypothetical protein
VIRISIVWARNKYGLSEQACITRLRDERA